MIRRPLNLPFHWFPEWLSVLKSQHREPAFLKLDWIRVKLKLDEVRIFKAKSRSVMAARLARSILQYIPS